MVLLAGSGNNPITRLNDHVVRISTMMEPYPWHYHSNSDETFLVIEGSLALEFEGGTLELNSGQLLIIPRGVRHRAKPEGARSVNLKFELAQFEAVAKLGVKFREVSIIVSATPSASVPDFEISSCREAN